MGSKVRRDLLEVGGIDWGREHGLSLTARPGWIDCGARESRLSSASAARSAQALERAAHSLLSTRRITRTYRYGKDLSCQLIHRGTERTGPVVPVNCAALPSHLAESEVFGDDKGGYSGADSAPSDLFRNKVTSRNLRARVVLSLRLSWTPPRQPTPRASKSGGRGGLHQLDRLLVAASSESRSLTTRPRATAACGPP
jgi:hypothetical protein